MMTDNLKPIETCPNGHRYNTWKYDDICPVCNAKMADKEKSEEEWREILQLDRSQWACGALLCIRGINKGRLYTVLSGKNFIGSDPNMDLPVRGDANLVKKNHAVALYDEKTSQSMILSGDSKGMVYIQDQAVYAPKPLNNLDRIEMGDSEFLFVELCNSNFGWDDIGVGD